MRRILIAIMLLSITTIWAQFSSFNTAVTPLFTCQIGWGDFDQDGDYDLLAGGYYGSWFETVNKTWLYRNDGWVGGQNVFTDLNLNFLVCNYPTSALGDLDGDGDLDIVLMGSQGAGSNAILVYRNDGIANFVLVYSGSPGMTNGTIDLADYDGDGDLDMLLTGANGNIGYTKILRNDGISKFTSITHSLPNILYGTAKWVDYDKDGDLDVCLTGQLNSAPWRISKLYKNNGGTYIDSGIVLPALNKSSWEWEDLNLDGYLDFILMGNDGTDKRTYLYLGNAEGGFSSILHNLPAVEDGIAKWADYDNDGNPDLFLQGTGNIELYGSYYFCKVYHNLSVGSYAVALDLDSVTGADLSWADINSDGNLDVFASGYDNLWGNVRSYSYLNNSPNINQPPTAPTAVSFSTGDGLNLSWDNGDDSETRASALSYRVQMGSTPGAQDVISPGSNYETGFSYLPLAGRLGKKLVLRSLPSGTYHFSVQAIDGAYAASEWSAESSLTMLSPNSPWSGSAPFTLSSSSASPHLQVIELYASDPVLTPYPAGFESSSAWGVQLKADSGIADLGLDVGNGMWEAYIRQNGIWQAATNNSLTVVAGNGRLSFSGIDFSAKGSIYILVGRSEVTLPVELGFFNATVTANNGVLLSWLSHSESAMLGYRVYRNETNDFSSAILRTPILIPATNSTEDAQYSFQDSEVDIPAEYWYWLQAQHFGHEECFGPVFVKIDAPTENEVPLVSSLGSAYPNPFRQNTTFEVLVKEGSNAEVVIFNLKGQKVRCFSLDPGTHQINWDGKEANGKACAPGVYFYQFRSEGFNQSKKLLLL